MVRDWAFYGEGGEDWFGFKGVRALGDREPDILMIPLPGHTLGHCGIAVRSKDKWLLHAGDSYFFHGQMQASPTNAAGARYISAPRRHGPRHANGKPGAAADAKGYPWRRRDDLQQPRSRRLRELPLRPAPHAVTWLAPAGRRFRRRGRSFLLGGR